MSRDEVRRLLGRPRDIGFSDFNDEEIWSWRYREWGVRNMELYVQFDRRSGALKRLHGSRLIRVTASANRVSLHDRSVP